MRWARVAPHKVQADWEEDEMQGHRRSAADAEWMSRSESCWPESDTAMRALRTEFKDLQQMAIAVHSRSDESDEDSDE